MLSVVEVLEVLSEAETLATNNDFAGLEDLLSITPPEIIQADPTLMFLSAFARYMTGREDEARLLLTPLIQKDVPTRGTRLYRRVLNLQGILEVELGQLDRADALFATVQHDAAAVGDYRYVAYGTLNRGIIQEIQGNPHNALLAFERARVAFHRLGDGAGVAGCAHNLGMAYRRLNKLDSAEMHFTAAVDYFRENNGTESLLSSTIERALVLALRGEPKLAFIAAHHALTTAEELSNQRLVGEAARVLGKIALLTRQWRSAQEMLERAREVGRRAGLRLLQAEALQDLATVARVRGNVERQAELVAEAAMLYREMGALGRAQSLYAAD